MENTTQPEQLVWKRIFIALSALSLLFMPVMSLYHGQSGDEWIQTLYGNDIYNYFFHNDTRVLDYDVIKESSTQLQGQHYYGGLYDFVIVFLHKTFFSGMEELTFHHMINSLLGALLFIYTGLTGKHFGGWRVGVMAFLFIALSPRILGESMNNPKDIPFAFANICYLYYLLRYISVFGNGKAQWKYALLMGLAFGLATGFRIGGIILLPYTVLFIAAYYLWDPAFRAKLQPAFSKGLTTMAKHFLVTLVLGYIITIIFWPWAMQAPLSRPLEALEAMTKRSTTIRMLFEGTYIMNTDVPKYYTFKWISISTPLLILAAFVTGIVCIKPLSAKYGKAPVFLLLFTVFFPILYAIYKGSVLYDTWRHFFFVYPGIVLLAVLTCNYFIDRFTANKNYRYAVIAVTVIGMSLPLVWIVRNFPNEYVYFNELAGGAKGAFGVYDLDYYQNSGKQAAEWIKKHAPRKNGKTIVASNMSAYWKYFEKDTAAFKGEYVRYNDRDTRDWDYYVTYSRYISLAQLENNTWPPANAVHVISVNGVPISAVLERKTKKDMEADAAMQRQQLDSALVLYQQVLSLDKSNDMVLVKFATILAMKGMIQESLAALEQAAKIDAGNPAIYNMQAQIYKAVGDNARAQQAEMMLQQLMQ